MTVLPGLVNSLDSLTIIPIDSESLEKAFHSHGINIRYLGEVAKMSVVPHVKDICINDMLARVCKNILNKQISSMILDHQQAEEQLAKLILER
mmetsp:Transcript_39107/g.37439  ORF Transcript_39107/g.37439 Transcript_39107/m.37439 type:complete len:93 (-) Transcript_39107:2170-2448(-)